MSAHGSTKIPSVPRSRLTAGPFGRMFRNLPPWQPPGCTEPDQIGAIHRLSETAFEDESAGAEADNDAIPAAYTYFGQFIDHDITFDPTSSLQRLNDVDRLVNFRTPRFDLDSVYGAGPKAQPQLYERAASDRLLLGKNPAGEPDLPRNRDASTDDDQTDVFSRERTALIGDPRNDENIIVSQVQLAFLKFHDERIKEGKSFVEAQRLTRWHYQWVVVKDFLVRLCGRDLITELLGTYPGRPELRFYEYSEQPYMPVEFSVAAYRLGHSMVRPDYHLSERLRGIRGGQPLAIFGSPEDETPPRHHLNGGRELPPSWTIQWDMFVVHDGSTPQLSRLIDTKLAPPLRHLPLGAEDSRFNSLTFLNLLRGWRMGLPSGQAVAARMGETPLEGDDPLWLYVLREAEQSTGGRALGPVGARIVGEVFVGLLAADPFSWFRTNPSWQPELEAADGDFQLADFLRHADMPMTEAQANDVMTHAAGGAG